MSRRISWLPRYSVTAPFSLRSRRAPEASYTYEVLFASSRLSPDRYGVTALRRPSSSQFNFWSTAGERSVAALVRRTVLPASSYWKVWAAVTSLPAVGGAHLGRLQRVRMRAALGVLAFGTYVVVCVIAASPVVPVAWRTSPVRLPAASYA